MCQLYTASQTKLKKEIENISLKKFHIFLIFPLILFFDEAQYNCHSSHSKKKHFFSLEVYTYAENIVFLNRDIFSVLSALQTPLFLYTLHI